VKKQIVQPPQLPAFAIPGKKPAALPATGAELHQRLQDKDARLAKEKRCDRGALLAHVTQAGVKAGYPHDLTKWDGPAIAFAVEAVKEFEAAPTRFAT
jgi:hypothetical protein